MLKRLWNLAKTLEAWFLLLILPGVLVAGIFGFYDASVCLPAQKKHWNEQSTQEQPPADNGHYGRFFAIAYQQPKTRSAENESAAEPPFCDVRFTDVLLALFTYCLVIVGWLTVLSGKRTVRELERAILFVERVTDGTEGAHDGISDIKFAFDDESGDLLAGHANAIRNASIAVRFKNHGKTPAIIKSLTLDVSYFGGSPEPRGMPLDLPGAFIVSSGEWSQDFFCMLSITRSDFLDHGVPKGGIYLVGAISYSDIFHVIHETGFCWQWSPFTKRFHIADSQLNYFN